MTKQHLLLCRLATFGMFLNLSTAIACTGGALTAKDGGTVVGRTPEFGVPLDSNLVVWPAGSSFQGTTATGRNGLAYQSKYGFIGMSAADMFDQIVDGMNEKGLNVGLFYFPGYAEYAEPTPENAVKGLSPGQVSTWILANFATVDEVKQHIDRIAALPVVIDILKSVPDVHYKVQDASGQAIVIEPVDGQLKVYDNPVRVLTNAPGFEFHLTNLNTYLDLSPGYPQSRAIGDLKLVPFGMGAGAVGLPGDFTPPSRFVRMAFFTQNVPEQPDTTAATATLFHLLNNFDVPVGSAQPPAGTAEVTSDYTTWTAVSDLKKLQFHWKTFGHQTVRVVDLHQALKTAGHKMIHMSAGPQAQTDVSHSVPTQIK
ncbi:Choloylglycine hydrolase-like protein [Thiocapsa sp. KS1]|nr:choloylglycine hydrolase family protein [Thiocapsa sp. KS1]CRI65647.1 Choloylglycine hydrolase-like protein [Thiocapsa sp. KS1]